MAGQVRYLPRHPTWLFQRNIRFAINILKIRMKNSTPNLSKKPVSTYRIVQTVLAIVFSVYLIWRLFRILSADSPYGPDTWTRFAISGLIIGSVYALVAIGYTLVYGILFMINFAHGDIMMIGAFGGYFVFEALKAVPSPTAANPNEVFLNAYPIPSIVLAFAAGIGIAALSGYLLEK